jgi:hypothetical protein
MRRASTAASTSALRPARPCSPLRPGSSPSPAPSRWAAERSRSKPRTVTRSRSCISARSSCGAGRLSPRAASSGPSARAEWSSCPCPTSTSACDGPRSPMGTWIRCSCCPALRYRRSGRLRPVMSHLVWLRGRPQSCPRGLLLLSPRLARSPSRRRRPRRLPSLLLRSRLLRRLRGLCRWRQSRVESTANARRLRFPLQASGRFPSDRVSAGRRLHANGLDRDRTLCGRAGAERRSAQARRGLA